MSTIQRITSSYVIDSDFSFRDLPRLSGDFLEIASVSDFGILLSVALLFNNRGILVKCVIDDELVFEIDLNVLDQMIDLKSGISNGMPFFFDDAKDLFIFKPSSPLMFRNSVKFFAKASTNSNSRDFESGVIERTKE